MPTNSLMRLLARCAIALAATLAAPCLSDPLHAAEEILSFEADILVRGDGVLDVTETLRVRAEGDQIKRGIYRDFPLTFRDAEDRRRRVGFRLRDVTRDGAPEPHHTAGSGDGVRIYAGEEDVFLPDGIYTYVFRYETDRQIRFLPEHTELFWNVTGNEWAFPILAASASIELPDARAPIRWTAYTGAVGERGADFSGRIRGDNALDVTTTRPLAPGEGLSVVVEMPDGLLAPPGGLRALYYWYLDNRPFIFGALGIFGVLAFYLWTWLAVGRDPPKGTIIPLFHPPEGISPAVAGYVRDWGWRDGWRAFTAATISLAVKGLIVFDDSADSIVLSLRDDRQRQPGIKLPPGEAAILDWIGRRDGSVTINKANGRSIAGILNTFKRKVEGENRNRFFSRNLGYFVAGLFLTAVALVVVLIFGDLSEGEIGLLVAVGMVSVFVGVFVAPIVRLVTRSRRNVRSVIAAAINLIALAVIGGMAVSIGSQAYRSLPDGFATTLLSIFLTNGFPFVLVGGFAAMNGLFFYLLRAPTAAGRKVMDEIEGLELYIRTAETGRLNAAGTPDLTSAHFERLLPYAIAFDAEKPWSEAFSAAFARAHPGQDAATTYRPGWHGGHGWRGGDFGRSISSTVSTAQSSFASAVPAPKSSSSGFSGGGGGGSGGGGGGGGGGGW